MSCRKHREYAFFRIDALDVAADLGHRGARQKAERAQLVVPPRDDQFVLLDNLVSVNEVSAIEVYPRGASIPPSLPTVDASCGLVEFWTGGRKAP